MFSWDEDKDGCIFVSFDISVQLHLRHLKGKGGAKMSSSKKSGKSFILPKMTKEKCPFPTWPPPCTHLPHTRKKKNGN